MKNKKDLQCDKYGFAQTGIISRISGKKLISSVSYENQDIIVDFDMIFANKGMFGNISNINKFKNMVEGKNIIEAFTAILLEKFSISFDHASLSSYIENLPEELLMNDEAVKEILARIPANDNNLLVAVSNKIEFNRLYVETRDKAKETERHELKQEADKIREKYGL